MAILDTIKHIADTVQKLTLTRADINLNNLSSQGKENIAKASNGIPWSLTSNVITGARNVGKYLTAKGETIKYANGGERIPYDGLNQYIATLEGLNDLPQVTEEQFLMSLCQENGIPEVALYLVPNPVMDDIDIQDLNTTTSGGNLKTASYDYLGEITETSKMLKFVVNGQPDKYISTLSNIVTMALNQPKADGTSNANISVPLGTVYISPSFEVLNSTGAFFVVGDLLIDSDTGNLGNLFKHLMMGTFTLYSGAPITEVPFEGRVLNLKADLDCLKPIGRTLNGTLASKEETVNLPYTSITFDEPEGTLGVLLDENNVPFIAPYTVAYEAPLSPKTGDVWYNLADNLLQKWENSWKTFEGLKIGVLSRNVENKLIFTFAECVQLPDMNTIMTEIDLAKAPVGTVIAYMGTDEPEGYLLMDGRELSRTTYHELFKVIGTSQGEGDGSTTFSIADMTDGRYLMGSTVAGGSVGAGLPEIYGWFGGDDVVTPTGGAFWRQANVGGHGLEIAGAGISAIHFHASRYNSIYGSSTTVTPQSVQCFFFIKF